MKQICRVLIELQWILERYLLESMEWKCFFNESKQWPIGFEPSVRSSGNQINKEIRRLAIIVYCILPTKNSRDKI